MFSLSPAFALGSGRAMIFTANSSPDFLSVANLTTAKPAGTKCFCVFTQRIVLLLILAAMSAASACNTGRACRLLIACIAGAQAHLNHQFRCAQLSTGHAAAMQLLPCASDEIKSQGQTAFCPAVSCAKTVLAHLLCLMFCQTYRLPGPWHLCAA